MIKKPTISDIRQIKNLVNYYAGKNLMLRRHEIDIYENLRDFYVWKQGATVLGVVALRLYWGGLCEIRSLAVRRDKTHKGIGAALVRACLKDAKTLKIKRVFLLTYVPSFFKKLGFKKISKKFLPNKIWADCLNCINFPNECAEVAMIKRV
jgi:amino-acid N-acetyltransferase